MKSYVDYIFQNTIATISFSHTSFANILCNDCLSRTLSLPTCFNLLLNELHFSLRLHHHHHQVLLYSPTSCINVPRSDWPSQTLLFSPFALPGPPPATPSLRPCIPPPASPSLQAVFSLPGPGECGHVRCQSTYQFCIALNLPCKG